MMLKAGNLVLFAEVSTLVIVHLVAANPLHGAMAAEAACRDQQKCDCKNVFQKLDTINGKLDKLLKSSECKSITGLLKSINVDEPKTILAGIGGAHSMVTKGSDLYIIGWKDGFVYRYNTQQGGSEPTKITSNILDGRRLTLAFMDLRDDILYITDTLGKAIYQVPLNGGEKKHTSLGEIQPLGISVSPDGQMVIIDEWSTGLIRVYDRTMTKLADTIDAKADCGPHLREITFLSDDKFILSGWGPDFCVYQKGNDGKFTHVKPNKKTTSNNLDGYYVHCDGTIIATDRQAGKLIEMDKNFNTIDTLSGFQSDIVDVTITDDGTLAVSNHNHDTVKLYSLW